MAMKPTRRLPVINQFGMFPVRVSRVQQLSEHFVRISLAGPSLHHAVNEISDGSGDVLDAYIKLFIPAPGQPAPVDFELNDTWRHTYMSAPAQQRGWMRTYTINNSRLIPAHTLAPQRTLFRANGGADLSVLEREIDSSYVPEVDMDFVLHTDESGSMGPGAAWARDAKVGDEISFLAPLRENNLWSSWNSANAQKILVLADETAVPAALSIVRSLEPGVSADILLEVPTAADVMTHEDAGISGALENLPDVRVSWLPRAGEQESERGEELYRKLRQILEVPLPLEYRVSEQVDNDEIVWGLAGEDHEYYVFIAGESAVIKTLRRICVNDAGLNKSNISFMGYWKSGKAES